MGNRNKLNYVVDGIIGVSFVLSALTGLVFLLPGAAGAGGRAILGLSRGTWSDLHTWVSLVLVGGLLVHLALHWKWIVCMTAGRPGRRASQAPLNYALDLVIAIVGVAVLLTGLVFLLAGQGGFQGGRNPAFQADILGLGRQTWSDLHTWASLVFMAGVVVHLALHWDWIVCTTKRLLRAGGTTEQQPAPTPCRRAPGAVFNRRSTREE